MRERTHAKQAAGLEEGQPRFSSSGPTCPLTSLPTHACAQTSEVAGTLGLRSLIRAVKVAVPLPPSPPLKWPALAARIACLIFRPLVELL
jgi:hypothetical protein